MSLLKLCRCVEVSLDARCATGWSVSISPWTICTWYRDSVCGVGGRSMFAYCLSISTHGYPGSMHFCTCSIVICSDWEVLIWLWTLTDTHLRTPVIRRLRNVSVRVAANILCCGLLPYLRFYAFNNKAVCMLSRFMCHAVSIQLLAVLQLGLLSDVYDVWLYFC